MKWPLGSIAIILLAGCGHADHLGPREQTRPHFMGAGAAYDPERDRFVILAWDETWEWNGSNWTRITLYDRNFPERAPQPRYGAKMVYDPDHHLILLFGGVSSAGADCPGQEDGQIQWKCGDTWSWDGTAWTKLASTGPEPRTHHALAYDSSRHRAVLYGGYSSKIVNTFYALVPDTTWEWDGTTWSAIREEAVR